MPGKILKYKPLSQHTGTKRARTGPLASRLRGAEGAPLRRSRQRDEKECISEKGEHFRAIRRFRGRLRFLVLFDATAGNPVPHAPRWARRSSLSDSHEPLAAGQPPALRLLRRLRSSSLSSRLWLGTSPSPRTTPVGTREAPRWRTGTCSCCGSSTGIGATLSTLAAVPPSVLTAGLRSRGACQRKNAQGRGAPTSR